MSLTTSRLPMDDGAQLAVYQWAELAGRKPRAVVQIVHGVAEHARRYDAFARALNTAGYAVVAADHRGHGQSAGSEAELGHFADRDGWRALVDDQYAITRHAQARFPGTPVVLFGHSMGSFITQDYLGSHGGALAGAILSGTNSGMAGLVRVARGIAKAERLRVGARGKSRLLQAISFGSYNGRFSPARTKFDWLSRDPAEVDKYVADPLCGFDLSTQGFVDLFTGLIRIDDRAAQARIPKALPIFAFAGSDDPVARFGEGVTALVAAYERAGLTDVRHNLYPSGRHELLNDPLRHEVTADIVAWLDGHFGAAG